jgi:ATP synthase protein I
MLSNRSQAYWIVLGQLAISLLAALTLLAIGWIHAYSGLIGGMIAALANVFFASRVFVRYRAQEPEKLLGRFYGAELQKLVLTAALFAAAIIGVKPLSAMALFGVYLLAQMVPILVSRFLD